MELIKTEITHPNLANIEVMGKRIVELEALIEKAVRGLPFMSAYTEELGKIVYMFGNSTNYSLAYDDNGNYDPNANIREVNVTLKIYNEDSDAFRNLYIGFKRHPKGFQAYFTPPSVGVVASCGNDGSLSIWDGTKEASLDFTKEFSVFCLELKKDQTIINPIKDLIFEVYTLTNEYEAAIKQTESEIKASLETTISAGDVYKGVFSGHLILITKRSGNSIGVDYYVGDEVIKKVKSVPVKSVIENTIHLPTARFRRYGN
jgi:hypothetical protein